MSISDNISDPKLRKLIEKLINEKPDMSPESIDIKQLMAQSLAFEKAIKHSKNIMEEDNFDMASYEAGIHAGALVAASFVAFQNLRLVERLIENHGLKFHKEHQKDSNHTVSDQEVFNVVEIVAAMAMARRLAEVLIDAFEDHDDAAFVFKATVEKIVGKDHELPVHENVKDMIENNGAFMGNFTASVALQRKAIYEKLGIKER